MIAHDGEVDDVDFILRCWAAFFGAVLNIEEADTLPPMTPAEFLDFMLYVLSRERESV